MTCLEAALEYSRKGWLVFPLHGIVEAEDGKLVCTCRVSECPDAGKHPVTRRGVKDASTDEETIKLWWAVEPYNVGIVAGEKSGLTILDIDVGEKGGDQTWAALTRDSGEPDTRMARTGSGGVHIFFHYNSVLKTSSNTLGKGIDCRNDGGYVVAPPSRHRKGGYYTWVSESALASLPAHLAKKPDKKQRKGRAKYKLGEVQAMLACIPSDDRDLWRSVGIILGREFSRDSKAWDVYVEWSDKWGGVKGRNHDIIMHEAFDILSQEGGDASFSIGTIVKQALDHGWSPLKGSIPIENFMYYAAGNSFIYRPTGADWMASAVDAACAMVNDDGQLKKASDWIKEHKLITSITSDPLIQEEILKEHDSKEGHIIPSPGGALFNSFRWPTIDGGKAALAEPWLIHVRNVFRQEGDADQFLNYLAHRVQHPGIKPRFALVLVGDQGVGKDTAIDMAKAAIGEWNVENVDPRAIQSDFNDYVAKVLIVVSEAANTQDMSKWSFNEQMKVMIAGTPDAMRVNPKYGHKFTVRMHCGVIITTNHISGLYIPADDRRYDVIKATSRDEMGFDVLDKKSEYFTSLWGWFYREEGARHIAAFLKERDIAKWNANEGQRRTEAHKEIVAHGFDSDTWASDALAKLGSPAVITLEQLWGAVQVSGEMTKKDMATRIAHIMPRLGYRRLVNFKTKDGRWKISEQWHIVFYDNSQIDEDGARTFVSTGNAKAAGAF